MKRSEATEDNRQAGDARAPYEPPAVVVLGSVKELTEGNALVPGNVAVNGSFSDRAMKEDVRPVDVGAVCEAALGVAVSGWRYRGDDQSVRHIGPMAQDFAAAFGVGSDDRRIEMVDAFGVALACIQALYGLVEDREAQISALWGEVRELRRLIDERESALVAG